MTKVEEILQKDDFSKSDLVELLKADGDDKKKIFEKAAAIKKQYVGNKVYFRGLIEFSNICAKNCYYCGIRSGNKKLTRYYVTEAEVLDAVKYAHENKYASLVIQAGERSNKKFVNTITNLLHKINELTNNEMGITLSLGEQTEDTLIQWREAGAKRYLLRIEASNPELYRKLHPNNKTHDFETRLNALHLLRKTGYQVGTGVMIGLPFQTIEDLADDLLFFKEFDIDMAGMGPYIEHEDTPLYQYRHLLMSKKERFDLSLKMVALLRIMMKDINIAATTAMQTLDKMGREKAIKVGSNIIMPNLTPVKYRDSYLLYEDKPCIDEEASECKNCLEARIHISGAEIGYGEWGDSLHFGKKEKS
ncbi:MAG: [FeFe] hydrogenase H-cluster radical SAM maturase HydE [Bacteroidetes bacterium]|nr:[FeFe] hydrogenase H-cluster radical SAM maturase HydE [Bacteroidota bacterium]